MKSQNFGLKCSGRQEREGGKKTGAVRKTNRPWASHAMELARGADASASNEKIACAISDRWKRADVDCPGIRTSGVRLGIESERTTTTANLRFGSEHFASGSRLLQASDLVIAVGHPLSHQVTRTEDF